VDSIHSRQDRTLVLSGRIWPMVIVLVITALDDIVLSVWRGIGTVSDRTEVIVVPLVRAGQCGVFVLVKGTHAWLGSTSLRSFQGS
jgi:hypothetical protein